MFLISWTRCFTPELGEISSRGHLYSSNQSTEQFPVDRIDLMVHASESFVFFSDFFFHSNLQAVTQNKFSTLVCYAFILRVEGIDR